MATGCCWPSVCSCPSAVSTALFMAVSSCASRRALPQIEECEDEYPHQIDEVPIQARDLHGLIGALAVIKSRPDPAGYDSQVDHAGRDVQAVETGDHEKTRSKLWRAPGISPRTDPFGDELGPF